MSRSSGSENEFLGYDQAISAFDAALVELDDWWRSTEEKLKRRLNENAANTPWNKQLRQLHEERYKKYQHERARINLLYKEFLSAGRDILTEIESEVEKYGKRLSVKRRQLELKNEYGGIESHRWTKELERFVEANPAVSRSILELDNYTSGLGVSLDWKDTVVNYIDKIIVPAEDFSDDENLNPGDAFELECENKLAEVGWSIKRIGASGDQGVDLLCVKDGTEMAVQCKDYARPIGNHAVQEVYAGRQFHGAHVAVLVGRSGFTESARNLAATSGVLLIDFTELSAIDDWLN